MPKLLFQPEVSARVGKCRASLYQYIAEGRFPKPVKIGDRRIAWVESEIDEWIAARIAERDGQEAA